MAESVWVVEFKRWVPTGYDETKDGTYKTLAKLNKGLDKYQRVGGRLGERIDKLMWQPGWLEDEDGEYRLRRKLSDRQKKVLRKLKRDYATTVAYCSNLMDEKREMIARMAAAKHQRVTEAHARIMTSPEWVAAAKEYMLKGQFQHQLAGAVEYSMQLQAQRAKR